ncbi:hypothetical protein HPB47_025982 [Ixodes persulcatus]|uniref:Uncharacterized protein n=1 Tax=Ixodes persulcatus TaxID=34615 RepID=A0AC60Q197_IXOPE|nr:hypothetical protein HPB47_025982 [Ixodes persulcatus]
MRADGSTVDKCRATDSYPGPLYAQAAQQLVAKFPVLRDDSKTRCDVWRGHLRVKSKNKRRAMADSVPGVGEARTKNQKAKEAKIHTASAGPSVRHIARHLNGVTFWGDAEDEESVAGHLNFMARELRKTSPDWEKIAVSMECTFEERRVWMDATQPLVADVIQKYPALGHAQAIYQEFFRLTKCEASMLEEALKKVGKRVVALVGSKRKHKAAVTELYERLDALAEVERDGCFATGVLLLLPHLLKEDGASYLQKLDPSKVHAHPTVLHSGATAFSADSFLVTVEDLSLDTLDVVSSVSLMLSMYWAFNIKYAPGTISSAPRTQVRVIQWADHVADSHGLPAT